MNTIQDDIIQQCQRAKTSSHQLAAASLEVRNKALMAIADKLSINIGLIKQENSKDVENGNANGLSSALLDRLLLDGHRIESMIQGIREIVRLADPLGIVKEERTLDSQLALRKVSTPIGLLGIIFESRPNVTCDAAALCLKSGNSVILRGGTEALHSNKILAQLMREALEDSALSPDCIQLIAHQERNAVTHLIQADSYVDLVIPRGGEGLISAVCKNATVPVIKHYKGVCHVYIDKEADLDMAIEICLNAKCQRPGVCNAVETILIHQDISTSLTPKLCQALENQGVSLVADDALRTIYSMEQATDEDWSTEYLDLKVSLREVKDLGAAIEHINHFGSHHSDAIVTNDRNCAQRFQLEVDSAAVYHNASTRFTDGSVFGLGAEIGISTDKLHARGPMGMNELTSYKFVIDGNGQCR